MDAPPTHLTAADLAMRFGRRLLFRGLSFEAVPGAPLAIVGSNGAGKSTLVRILAGVLTPVAGEVRLVVSGQPVAAAARPRRVGLVAPYLQHYDLFSARENLSFLARAYGISDAGPRIDAVLDRVGLLARADDRLATYSTGMRQRLRLAGALLPDPPVLLLDEPSATLDEAGQALVEGVIAMRNKVVVVATNDPAEAARCAHTVSLGGR
ncbi:MAG TPA: ATP-binding cassette domain-containing protein [Rubricoccaceae bacterium]|nr:ATP-binding cassette domain-containing protein [Rubricoccaceae bacterium]